MDSKRKGYGSPLWGDPWHISICWLWVQVMMMGRTEAAMWLMVQEWGVQQGGVYAIQGLTKEG